METFRKGEKVKLHWPDGDPFTPDYKVVTFVEFAENARSLRSYILSDYHDEPAQDYSRVEMDNGQIIAVPTSNLKSA